MGEAGQALFRQEPPKAARSEGLYAPARADLLASRGGLESDVWRVANTHGHVSSMCVRSSERPSYQVTPVTITSSARQEGADLSHTSPSCERSCATERVYSGAVELPTTPCMCERPKTPPKNMDATCYSLIASAAHAMTAATVASASVRSRALASNESP